MVMQIDIDKDSKVRIINKEDIKNKIGRSPDYSDACMMRCYFSLIYDYEALEEGEELIPLTIYD
jgi:hypothetical protein